MPYTIRRRKNCFRVVNTDSKRVFSKCSTKDNANRQIRLLRAIKYDKNFIQRTPSQRAQQTRNRSRRK